MSECNVPTECIVKKILVKLVEFLRRVKVKMKVIDAGVYDSWRVTDLSSGFKDESWRADCCHYSGRRTFLLSVVGKGDPSGVASLNDARKFVPF